MTRLPTRTLWIAASLFLIANVFCTMARSEGVVLLSFDTEFDPDAAALEELAIDVSATYFFTGEYAMAFPDLVQSLAEKGNTIGSHSHSHDHLQQLAPEHLEKDLRLSKMVIEAISGVEVKWFRAPFLEYDRDVMRTVRAVGLSYDSSDISDWLKNDTLPELALSYHEGRLASDYGIFERDQLSDADALDWLVDAYETRADTGQPLVVLMHPRIIGEHASVLRDFIAHVQAVGGTFQTMDGYSDGLSRMSAPEMVGLWVDLSFESVDPAKLVADARSIGVTDVFLSVIDPAGVSYLEPDPKDPDRALVAPIFEVLKRAGIRVHAWIAVNSNVALARERPDIAMRDAGGVPSTQWVSPSSPEARAILLDTVRTALTANDFDGLHLDYIRYPGLEADFSDPARARFTAATDLDASDPEKLVSDLYGVWVNWRMREIEDLVAEIRRTAQNVAGQDIVLSAALIGDAAVNFRSREKFGQDYRLLARQLDLILPMAYYPIDRQDTDWVRRLLFAARWQAGDTPVVAGLVSFNEPGSWTLGEEDMATALSYALTLSDGATFYPYSGLFNRRDAAGNVGERVLDTVRTSLAEASRWRGLERILRIGDSRSRVLAILAASLAILALGLAISGRRRLRSVGAETVQLTPSARCPYHEWRKDDAECQRGKISGATCARISQQLRALPADVLDAARLMALLPSPGSAGGAADRKTSASAENLLLQENAVGSGLLVKSGAEYRPTGAGRAMLEAARRHGIDSESAGFLMRRMQESLSAPCTACGTINSFHYFWSSFECKKCGKANSAQQAKEILVSLPGSRTGG